MDFYLPHYACTGYAYGVTGSEIVQKTVGNHADSEVLFNSAGSAQNPCQNFWSKIKLPSGSFWTFKGMSVNIYVL